MPDTTQPTYGSQAYTDNVNKTLGGTMTVGFNNGTYSRLPTPASTPAPTPTPAITPSSPSSGYGFTLDNNGNRVWTDASGKANGLVTAAPFDETNSRNNQIAAREGQFSTINDLYNSRIKTMSDAENKLGATDLARANTISALTGGAGGVDAQTRGGTVERKTNDIIQKQTDAINAEKAAAISGVFDKIDQNVAAEKQAAITADKAERTAIVDKMNKDAQSNIMSFATHNITWDKAMATPEFADEVRRSGKDAFTLQKEYEVARAAQNPQMTNFTTKVSGGSIVSSWVDTDPVTGKHTPKFETTPLPKGAENFGHSHYDPASGKLLLWDDNGNSKVTTITGGTGGDEYAPSKSDISGAVTWMRAQPDYTPDMEKTFTSDKVKQAQVIQAWKAQNNNSNSSNDGM